MSRSIVGFHLDHVGDWVAELSCLHNQHVRRRDTRGRITRALGYRAADE